MSTLEIPNEIYAQMLEQARQEAPVEACGMLAGVEGRVSKLYRMTNADAAHDHFMMTPEEQFAVVKDIRAEGLVMLAIYHSHPASPARLSQEDIRLALTPGVMYVIVSLVEEPPVVKGFLIDNDSVTEVPVTVEEGSQ
ncbi:MAG: M67 family metallopeptidase [Phycisphaerae bacterium]|jgi:proteasome lid subunit RPN8/RPN11|nr:M67 family metallopeptidase [Phycisphaerae bacterium]